jgi:hypothetical protein
MSRTVLNKLLSHSFDHYPVLYNKFIFHNHTVHHLGSIYFLGATDDKLEEVYETMCEHLDPYEPSPQEINLSNWRQHLGNKYFCKSYRDFFNEQLTTNGNNWKKKFIEFLLDNKEQPMINSVVSGLGHSLIHIGYAFELDSQVVGIEALTMTAIYYDYLHEVIDKLQPPKSPSKSALEIFKNIHTDSQLPIYDTPGADNNPEQTVKNCNDRVFYHYNQWKINKENLEKSVEELFDLTVYIYGATHKPNEIEFDFFLVHLLTSMHAIRIISSHIDNQDIFGHLLLQFFYFAIVIYISQLRPKIDEHLIHDYKIDEEKNNWNYVIDRSLNTKLVDDSHLVKVIRALRDAENVYGNGKDGLYLKTAVKTVDNVDFDEIWTGFEDAKRQLNIVKHS